MVSILKNMGTNHNELLQKKCKLTREWCKSKNISLFLVYVNTEHNFADKPLRKIYIQGEWMIARTIFSKALIFNITPKIDLFTSRLKTANLCLKKLLNQTQMSVQWTHSHETGVNYNFMLSHHLVVSLGLQKIKADKAEGMLVIPHWLSQPFYSKIMKMTKGLPVIIPANAENLNHPNG